MPAFDEEFASAQGKPVYYRGIPLVRLDRFPTEGARTVRVTFEANNGSWRQGVRLKCAGVFSVNGLKIAGNAGFVLWRDTAPESVQINIQLAKGQSTVIVYNVWDVGDKTIHSWHNGAAMIAEDIPNGRRYRCNDGEPDDDFDDLIFRIERDQ
jgi:hypothetical protein